MTAVDQDAVDLQAGWQLPRTITLCLSDMDTSAVLLPHLQGMGILVQTDPRVPSEILAAGAPQPDLLIVDLPMLQADPAGPPADLPILVLLKPDEEMQHQLPAVTGPYPTDSELRDGMWFATAWHLLAGFQVPLMRLLFGPRFWVMAIDPAFARVQICSTEAMSPWQLTAAELLTDPRRLVKKVHPDDRERVARNYERLFHTRSPRISLQEYRVLRPDGHTIWVQERLLPLATGESGRRLLSVAQDITQRREEHRRVLESRGIESAMLDDLAVGLEELDGAGRVIYLNRAACTILDQPERQLLGAAVEQTAATSEAAAALREFIRELTQPSNRDRDTASTITPSLRGDGQVVLVRRNLRVTRDSLGDPNGCSAVLTDVTHELRREHELRESARVSQLLLDSMPFSAALINRQGQVLAANRQARQTQAFPGCQCLHPDRDMTGDGSETGLRPAICGETPDTCGYSAVEKSLAIGERIRREVHRHGKIWDTSLIPVDDDTVLYMAIDITERWERDANLRAIINSISTPVGQSYFDNLVRSLSEWLGVDGALVAEFRGDTAHSLAFNWQGEFIMEFEYPIDGGPCGDIGPDGILIISDGVRTIYPNNDRLKTMDARCYAGAHITNRQGQVVGVICAFGTRPLRVPAQAEEILGVLAARTASEFERRRADEALSQAAAQLELRVQERTAEIAAANRRLRLYRQVDSTVAEILHLTHSSQAFKPMLERAARSFIRLRAIGASSHVAIYPLAGETVDVDRAAFAPIHTDLTIDLERDLAIVHRSERPESIQNQRGIRTTIPVWADDSPQAVVIVQHNGGRPPAADDMMAITVVARALGVVIRRAITEESLNDMQHDLRRSEKLATLGKLAGGIAHDFNNQLTVIVACAGNLSGRNDDPAVAEAANQILQAAQNLSQVTSKLLLFSPNAVQKFGEFDLRQVLHTVLDLLEHTVDKRIRISHRMPQEPVILRGDEGHILNSILNVALNAADAMNKGGRLDFDLSLKSSDEIAAVFPPSAEILIANYAQLVVTDTGCGIDPDDLTHVFDPGFTTKPPGESAGLGLTAVQRVMEEHLGLLDIRSEIGVGTTVRMAFTTVQLADEHPLVSPTPSEPPALPVDPVSPARIMVVEDRDLVRMVVTDALEADGHDVRAYGSPLEALDVYRNDWRQIDLLILDLIMPEINGFELFQKVRQINPDAMVIIASGYIDRDGRLKHILDAGGCLFLQKPYMPHELAAVVNTALAELRAKGRRR